MESHVDKTSSEYIEQFEKTTTQAMSDTDSTGNGLAKTKTIALEEKYNITLTTYLVLAVMGVTWGTCTLANIGPSTTFSFAVADIGGAAKESWIPNAALFPLIGLQPFWGALADRFGKKWLIVIGGFFGVAGNAVAGSAKNIETVIAGQALNGIAVSLLLLVIPASMEIVSAKNRPFAQGGLAVINGSMAIIGLVESGSFAKMSISGWRWVYYFNAIFFGICALLIATVYRPPPTKLRRENTIASEFRSIDYLGILLLLLGVVGIVTSLTWGGNAYPWNSSRVLAMLILGIAFLIGFCLYETFGRSDGLIDHRFLESRNFLLILSVAFVDGMLLYGVNAFFPIEAGAIFTSDPVKINVYLLPLNLLVLGGCLVAAFFLGKLRHYRILLCSSLFVIALFCGLLALVTPSRIAMTLVFTGIIGLGVGVTTVLPVVILSYSVPSYLLGTSETILASTRALGGTVGITIFASIFSNQMSKNLPTGIAKAAIAAGLPPSSVKAFLGDLLGKLGDPTAVPGVTPAVLSAAVTAIKDISAQSFKYVWIANMTIGLASGIFCLFLQSVDDKMNAHIESALEKGELRERQFVHPEQTEMNLPENE